MVCRVMKSRRKGVNNAPPGVMTSSACLGAELLLKLLGNYCRNADIRTSITVGVVGESHDPRTQVM